MRKLEQRKYNGGHYAPEIRQMTSYFAVKHMLWPGNDDSASVFSENVSRLSSGGSCSPKRGNKVPKLADFSPSPARSNIDKNRLSVHSVEAKEQK